MLRALVVMAAAWALGLGGCGGQVAATPRCSGSDYRVSVADQGATGSLVGMAGAIARRASPCHLQARLTFAIQKYMGRRWRTILPMAGNPAQARLAGLLKRGAPIGHDWAWSNYCGPSGRFRFLARTDSGSATIPVTPPECNSAATGPGNIRPFPPKGA